MEDRNREFQEVGHCGGQITVHVVTTDGHRRCSLSFTHSRPVPTVLTGVWALPQGIPLAALQFGGIGSQPEVPPAPGSFQVYLACDTEGHFGHECKHCKGYWRSGPFPLHCPYCGAAGDLIPFLTKAQLRFIKQSCKHIDAAINADDDGDYTIDLDAVADAAGKDGEKPPFYYAEQSQQHRYTCKDCGEFNDILGKFGFCSGCGSRNDLRELETAIQAVRQRINSGGPNEGCVKDAVSEFDSCVGRYVKQLLQWIPMTRRRVARFENKRFHNLRLVADDLKSVFDIDIFGGLSSDEIEFAVLMFHRRHVYEHSGGEADEKYIADSGDSSVKVKQLLRETKESAHRIANNVLKMTRNLHEGFHEIFPPNAHRIAWHTKRTAVPR